MPISSFVTVPLIALCVGSLQLTAADALDTSPATDTTPTTHTGGTWSNSATGSAVRPDPNAPNAGGVGDRTNPPTDSTRPGGRTDPGPGKTMGIPGTGNPGAIPEVNSTEGRQGTTGVPGSSGTPGKTGNPGTPATRDPATTDGAQPTPGVRGSDGNGGNANGTGGKTPGGMSH